MCCSLHLDIGFINRRLGGLKLLQIRLVIGVQLRGNLEFLVASDALQLGVGRTMILDHFLRELLDLLVVKLAQNTLARFDFEPSGDSSFVDEILCAVRGPTRVRRR